MYPKPLRMLVLSPQLPECSGVSVFYMSGTPNNGSASESNAYDVISISPPPRQGTRWIALCIARSIV